MHIEDKYLKAAVLGASDGIITTFAVVAGVVGAQLATEIIIVLGIANMVADGISMALGDFLGERSIAQRNSEKQTGIAKTSLVTFGAFIVSGSLPLLPYVVILFGFDLLAEHQFLMSIIATLSAMFLVGSLRTIVTKGKWWINGLEMLIVGSIAASVAYYLGAFVEGFIK
jgi:VIT1/CCC1 family predicted Fe2+/Mn2+ transporter